MAVTPSRAGERRGEEKRSEGARAPAVTVPVTEEDPDAGPIPLAEPGPIQADAAAVAELAMKATRLGGDPSWGAWVARMAATYPPAWIGDVLEKIRGRGQWRESYGEGILADYARRGGPDRRPGERTHAGRATAHVGPAPAGPPRPRRIPDGPAGDPVREAWAALAGDSRDAAELASRDCPHCGGSGWARLARPARRGPVVTGRTHCLCPAGEWLRMRAAKDDLERMPDLALVLEGRSPWKLED